ncbi:MAG: ABC transporter substrate-binding protein [Bacteroidota bacterium]
MSAYQKIINRRTILYTLGLLFLGTIVFLFLLNNKTHSPNQADPSSTPATANLPSKNYKVLHIMSYHSPWEWTDTLFSGFQSALSDLNIEYQVFQMDTKRYSSESSIMAKTEEARNLIAAWKPDLIYISDDDALKYLAKYYANSKLPIVFSAVNESPEKYGIKDCQNITGVLEKEHFVESVKLLKEVVPSVRKIGVITDDGLMWSPVIQRMKDRLNELPEVQFVSWDIIYTFAEYQNKIKEYERKVDAVALLGIFSFKDAQGENVPYQEVQRWTAENVKLPDFSFWKDRVSFGTLCVVSVSGFEQGLAAGKIARSILVDGKKPSDFPIVATIKGEPLISLARANQLGIKIKSSVLLSSQVVKKYFWEE